MFVSIFHSIVKRRDVVIFLAFSGLSLLIALVSKMGMGITLSGSGTSSFLAFFVSMVDLQASIFLPTLMLAFVVASVFRDDIDTGRLLLFKDLPKDVIFRAKLHSLYTLYALYLTLTALFSLVSYLILVGHFTLLPENHLIAQQGLKLLVQSGLGVMNITVIACLAIQKKTLVAVLSGLFVSLFSMTMPLWFGLQLLAPGYYVNHLTSANLWQTSLIVLVLLGAYIVPFYRMAARAFKNIQF